MVPRVAFEGHVYHSCSVLIRTPPGLILVRDVQRYRSRTFSQPS